METTHVGSGDNTSNSNSNNMLNSRIASYPIVRRHLFWILGMRTMADALPEPLQYIVNGGKLSALFFVGAYLIFVAIWLPFRLISLIVSEIGLYFILIGTVFVIGRGIIRMIAFPGSSNRVSSEIEKEFSKYSVKMIINSSNALIDLASAVSRAEESSSAIYYEIHQLWKRCKSFRDRVLAVYADSLSYIVNNGEQSSNRVNADLTKYGNNRLSGDIGNLSGLTDEARAEGKILLKKLTRVLQELDLLESQANSLLENSSGKPQQIPPALKLSANSVGIVASELRDFAESIRPMTTDVGSDDNDDEGDISMDDMRRQFEEQSGSLMDTIKSGLSSILPMLDPPLHKSIFGFDVQRGCMLSRYRGARQLWVQRPDGGMIDVIHIPARNADGSATTGKNAVMYCNPNAGLIEVATGLSLAGGNVDIENGTNENCWTDFYTNLGLDIYLFNYAGFGRSHGAGYCGLGKRGGEEPYVHGALGRAKRIFHSTFCGFQPTPETLRADGLAVGSHILNDLGVETLLIHGESIGGVAASAAARQLSQTSFSRNKVKLLICDRTFCNLEAVAQRLVGGWSAYAIRMLAPMWSTDVAGDYLAASCPKVVATDSADSIIFDSASLKGGIAFHKEINRGMISTKRIGWMQEAPIHYRMAVDYENVSVEASRYTPLTVARLTPPVWPQDKHISLQEGFHFAACTKRIGKMASLEKKKFFTTDTEAAMNGLECQSPIFQVWKYLGTCEGLCGAALGMAVRGGYDVTVSWLCSTLTFGGQTVIEGMEHRHKWTEEQARTAMGKLGNVEPKDFDCRPADYESQESETTVHPKPIPEVLEGLTKILEENPNDDILSALNPEISFVIGMLQYTITRLSSPGTVEASWKDRHLQARGPDTVGSFLNLHCGHNNPFSAAEKKRLRSLILQVAMSDQPSG